MTRRRVLVVQPTLQPPGGGNGAAAWVLQALQDHHDVGVLTWVVLDVDEVNRFYGTAVRRDRIHPQRPDPLVHRLLDRVPLPLALVKNALLQRAVRRIGTAWDVVLSLNNETDFGRRGIQYVHYPTYERPRPRNDLRWYHRMAPLLDGYYSFVDWLGDTSPSRLRANLTLVNSDWTGRIVRARHGIETVTLYPPVHSAFVDVPWSERANGFLCIGRVSPEKEVERVIEILSIVRRRRPEITLRILGTLRHDRYGRSMKRRIEAESSWVSLDAGLTRAEMLDLIPRYRYGIHGMREEHFGMAPAEMMAAGCVLFVPNGGGQTEIVGEEPRLRYGSVQEAAEKIEYVLAHPSEQAALRSRLAGRRALFTTERFMQAVLDLVETFPSYPQAG